MKILISWSGKVSQKVASKLKEDIPVLIPGIQPWVSSEDLHKGVRWSGELAKQLEGTQYGVFIVFTNNQESPWLNFEAGAISKWVEIGNVAPLLFGLSKSDLRGPLAQFQATEFTKEDFLKLLQSINTAAGEMVDSTKLKKTFDLMWPGFSQQINSIINEINLENDSFSDSTNRKFYPTEDHVILLQTVARSPKNIIGLTSIIDSVQMTHARVEQLIGELVNAGYLQKRPTEWGGRGYKVIDKGLEFLKIQGMI